MPIEIIDRYTRKLIHETPEKWFVFGDNCAREGYGGQAAEARGELNTIGICTKKAPTYHDNDFFYDTEYAENVVIIMNDFEPVLAALAQGRTVVWPADGIGTGIAMLPKNAPHTLHFIDTIVGSLKIIYGVSEFTCTSTH